MDDKTHKGAVNNLKLFQSSLYIKNNILNKSTVFSSQKNSDTPVHPLESNQFSLCLCLRVKVEMSIFSMQ